MCLTEIGSNIGKYEEMNMNMDVLIIEDDPRLSQSIGDIMVNHGFHASYGFDGKKALEQALLGNYELIILDVMLPSMDGFTIVENLREFDNDTPVLMLTAKSEIGDKVRGLDKGADYYLTKPFHTDELISCVNALLRRQKIKNATITYGNTTLQLKTGILECGEKSIRLSDKEFHITNMLMKEQHRNVSKETLLSKVWGYDSNAVENHVEVYISLIRKKLVAIGSNLQIVAIFRMGYHLQVHEDD